MSTSTLVAVVLTFGSTTSMPLTIVAPAKNGAKESLKDV